MSCCKAKCLTLCLSNLRVSFCSSGSSNFLLFIDSYYVSYLFQNTFLNNKNHLVNQGGVMAVYSRRFGKFCSTSTYLIFFFWSVLYAINKWIYQFKLIDPEYIHDIYTREFWKTKHFKFWRKQLVLTSKPLIAKCWHFSMMLAFFHY